MVNIIGGKRITKKERMRCWSRQQRTYRSRNVATTSRCESSSFGIKLNPALALFRARPTVKDGATLMVLLFLLAEEPEEPEEEVLA